MAINTAELLKHFITSTTTAQRRVAYENIERAKNDDSFFGLLYDWELQKPNVWSKPQFQRELVQGLETASSEAVTILSSLFVHLQSDKHIGPALSEGEIRSNPPSEADISGLVEMLVSSHCSPQMCVLIGFARIWVHILDAAKKDGAKPEQIQKTLQSALETAAHYFDLQTATRKIVRQLRGPLNLPAPEGEEEEKAKPAAKKKTKAAPAVKPSVAKITEALKQATTTPEQPETAVTAKKTKPAVVEKPAEPAHADPAAQKPVAETPVAAEKASEPAQKSTAKAAPEKKAKPLEYIVLDEQRAGIPKPPEGYTRTLGYARRYGQFINFYGVANWDSNLETFVTEEFKSIFPSFGAVNLKVSSPNQIADGAFLIIDWISYDLIQYRDLLSNEWRKDYVYQLDYVQLHSKGRVFTLEEAGGYPIVTPVEQTPDFQKFVYVELGFEQNAENSNKPFPMPSIPVVLRYKDYLYGPYSLKRDGANRPYINFGQLSNDGTVRGLLPDASDTVIFAQLMYWPENTGTEPFTRTLPIVLAKKSQPILIDTLSDIQLLERFKNTGQTENTGKITDWIDAQLREDTLFSSTPAFRESRVARISALLGNFRVNQQTIDMLGNTLMSHMSKFLSNSKMQEALAKIILAKPQYVSQLSSVKAVEEKISTLNAQLKDIEAKKATLESEIASAMEQAEAELRDRHAGLIKESDTLSSTNAKLRKEIGILGSVSDQAKLKASLQAEVDALKAQVDALQAAQRDAETHLSEAFSSPARYAFDGAISSKLLSAAAAWENSAENENYEMRARAVAAVKPAELSGHKLAKYLVKKVQNYRAYDDNTVLNFFILLTQNFLTIFSGPPGVGKTSICEILAHVMGLSSFGEQLTAEQQALWDSPMARSRFLPVSVERGWTSKRDFVGYYNPLSKTFESIDPLRRQAFAELDTEHRLGIANVPFVMMLDEANLSPMEYYWGDFMRICDKRNGTNAYVSLGGDAQYRIPDTLRFVATINNDFTTENLSPRLLDRASIVTLPDLEVTGIGIVNDDEVLPAVSWEEMQKYFGPSASQTHKTEVLSILSSIYDRFTMIGMPVSMRTRLAIQNYVSAASRIFTDTDQPGYIAAVDFAVMQRLLPRINGNGDAYRLGLSDLKTVLDTNGLTRSSRVLEGILARGDASMDWYRFF